MKFEDLEFKPTIAIAEKARLITQVVEGLFDGDEYLPEVFEEQYWLHVASAYMKNDSAELSTTPDDFMDALYNKGLMRKMVESINMDQLSGIRAAIAERIDLRLSRKPMDEFFEKGLALLVKFEGLVEGIDLKAAIEQLGKLDVNAEVLRALAENKGTEQ